MRYLFVIFITFYLTGCFSKEPEKTGHEGQVVPSFKLLSIDSTTVIDTQTIPSGEPFVIFLFGPNCPYSKAQMEEILKNMNILKHIQFYIITNHPFNKMKEFYNHYSLGKYSN